jgi:hypothetical protein
MLAGFAGAVPRHDALLGLCDLQTDDPHLLDQAVQHLTRQFRQTILPFVQRRDRCDHTAGTARGNDPELGKVPAQRIDQHRSLANQKIAHLVQHQHGLLLGGLDSNKAHRRPGHRFRDGLDIGGVGLPRLTYGLT